ncbi:hypothetical protein [Halobacillus sp. Marseille-Q1614]|uniref:hypothetical protein n=1 Tax=Halobacillus sp. Marseille-Q1614 TaxID=2709134 RepID=UPI001570B10A|nr:hypothetical protein [Halobacillus sp. Marseille-Q1614]
MDGESYHKALIAGWHPPVKEIIAPIPAHVSLHAIKHNIGAISDNRMSEDLETIETVSVEKKMPLDLPFAFDGVKFKDLSAWKPTKN